MNTTASRFRQALRDAGITPSETMDGVKLLRGPARLARLAAGTALTLDMPIRFTHDRHTDRSA
jgi:hypothetical protein